MAPGMRLSVRYNSSHPALIPADLTWTVTDLKHAVAQHFGVVTEEICLIFQGRELSDTVTLQDCGLGRHTSLHAVRARKHVTSADGGAGKFNKKYDSDSPAAESGGCGFYVYCRVCREIRFGRLHVRCSTCQQDTMTLYTGPSSWQDLLEEGRVKGECRADSCQGDVPKFWFKCGEHEGVPGEDEAAVGLPLVRGNLRGVACAACLDVRSPVLVFPCADAHIMCLDCFHSYCGLHLNDRTFTFSQDVGYTLPCPVGCDNSLIMEAHHFRVLGDDQYERYKRFAAEEFVLQQGGILCPSPGCGAGLIPDDDTTRRIVCENGCEFEFCRLCKAEYHEGSCELALQEAAAAETNTYHIDDEAAERACWDLESLYMINHTSRPCPHCGAATERTGGCMHMACSRCGKDWCWICKTPWNRDCQARHWFD